MRPCWAHVCSRLRASSPASQCSGGGGGAACTPRHMRACRVGQGAPAAGVVEMRALCMLAAALRRRARMRMRPCRKRLSALPASCSRHPRPQAAAAAEATGSRAARAPPCLLRRSCRPARSCCCWSACRGRPMLRAPRRHLYRSICCPLAPRRMLLLPTTTALRRQGCRSSAPISMPLPGPHHNAPATRGSAPARHQLRVHGNKRS